jgi:dimethylargininase
MSPPAGSDQVPAMNRGTALVRRPSSRLADGIVTYIARTHVDVAAAERQHEAYRAALSDAGWTVHEVAKADECPDSVFVEDTVVVYDDLAVLTRPGAAARRPEVDGTETVVRALGLDVVRIEPPGTLDGGDVLQVGPVVYVGLGGRTNDAGIQQLAGHLTGRGRNVVAVPLRNVLHLKSAVTALPDGSLLALPALVDAAVLPPLHAVDEETGCHVVPLGGDRVLIAASAPRTAAWLGDQGLTPVVVDIAEYEKLEGCVTCLSVLIPDQAAP